MGADTSDSGLLGKGYGDLNQFASAMAPKRALNSLGLLSAPPTGNSLGMQLLQRPAVPQAPPSWPTMQPIIKPPVQTPAPAPVALNKYGYPTAPQSDAPAQYDKYGRPMAPYASAPNKYSSGGGGSDASPGNVNGPNTPFAISDLMSVPFGPLGIVSLIANHNAAVNAPDSNDPTDPTSAAAVNGMDSASDAASGSGGASGGK